MSRRKEKFLIWLAGLLPRDVVYMAAMRLGAEVSTKVYPSVHLPEITFMDMMKGWGDPK